MKKKILETVAGLLIILVSFVLSFVYIENLYLDKNPLILIIAGVLCLAGMGVLFHAGRIDTTTMKFKDPSVASNNVLDRNNKIISEWNNISEKRDKLKMVTIVGDESPPAS